MTAKCPVSIPSARTILGLSTRLRTEVAQLRNHCNNPSQLNVPLRGITIINPESTYIVEGALVSTEPHAIENRRDCGRPLEIANSE